MGKRASSAAGKAAKMHKVPEAPVVPVEVAEEPEEAPIVEFLSCTRACGLTNDSRDMLVAALPHALRSPKHERHKYQLALLDTITGLLSEAESNARSGVEGAKAQAATHATDEATVAAELEAVQGRCQSSETAKDAAAARYKEMCQNSETAKVELEAAKAKKEAVAKDQEAVVLEKEHYEQLKPEWEQLEANNYHGKEWRQRDKTIAQVMKMLEKLDLPVSLMDSLPVAFKLKVDARGPFARLALETGKTAMQEHIDALASRIGKFGDDINDQDKAVAEADAALQAAEGAANEAMQALVDAENAWVGEASKVNDLKAQVKNSPTRTAELEAELVAADAELANTLKLVSRFKSLVEGAPEPELAAAPAVEEVADEAMTGEAGADGADAVVGELTAAEGTSGETAA